MCDVTPQSSVHQRRSVRYEQDDSCTKHCWNMSKILSEVPSVVKIKGKVTVSVKVQLTYHYNPDTSLRVPHTGMSCRTNRALAIGTIHEQPFTLPQFRISGFRRVRFCRNEFLHSSRLPIHPRGGCPSVRLNIFELCAIFRHAGLSSCL